MKFVSIVFCIFVAWGLSSCSSLDSDLQSEADAIEREASAHPAKGYKTSSYSVGRKRYYPMSVDKALSCSETGIASWYGRGKKRERTALGEYMYSKSSWSAAHKTLPLPCVIKVTCVHTGKSAIARVNDRGPFTSNRLIDVSPLVAHKIGLKNKGVGKVNIEVISVGDGAYKRTAS